MAVDSSNKYLTLPKDHIKIFASTWPNPTEGNPFYYRWEKLFGPEEGNLDGLHTKMVSLTNVREEEGKRDKRKEIEEERWREKEG